MPGAGFEAPVRWRPMVESTNDEVLALARGGAPEGSTVAAESQRAGRGRNGRTWVSPPGAGLYASLLLRTASEAEGLTLLPLLAGLACAEALRSLTAVEAGLKWPNDVLIGGRKVAGLLVEAEPLGDASGTLAVVLGLGVNLSVAPEALPGRARFPATSLHLETPHVPSRETLLAQWRARVAHHYAAWRLGEHAGLRRSWSALDALRGRQVALSGGGDDVRGVNAGIDTDGALRVRTSGGIVRVLAGDLQLVEHPA